MTAKAIMIQGTGSDVGKSLLVAGLCRIARQQGLKVAPFKPQNMSNNAAACSDGGEIGRAQALQARASGLETHTDFNPVLLKPQSDRTSQVVVHGRVSETLQAATYMKRRDHLRAAVLESFDRLTSTYDLIVVEGAGSPAEINLRARDIANMGFARAAGVPVCLAGDIDRGGVIASIVGTKAVIDPADAAMIRAFLINKFRGDPKLFEDGVRAIESQTGWPSLGVIPWLHAAAKLPAEDAVALSRPLYTKGGRLKIAAPMFSRIANFDDADPLRAEPGIDFRFIPPGQPIPRDADIVMLFGTKSTVGDLNFLREQGWDHDILAHARHGGHVFGVCGGYQMLGRKVIDPDGRDGPAGEVDGLGLLNIETVMDGAKRVSPVSGRHIASGLSVNGYEIHMGRTSGPDTERPLLSLPDGPDGARSGDGRFSGCYLHGLFANDEFRAMWMSQFGEIEVSGLNYEMQVDNALDELADGLKSSLDVERLFSLAEHPGWSPDK